MELWHYYFTGKKWANYLLVILKTSSTLKRVNYIFIRHKYKKNAVNLIHINLILELLLRALNDTEKKVIKYLILAPVIYIMISDEVKYLIGEGILS